MTCYFILFSNKILFFKKLFTSDSNTFLIIRVHVSEEAETDPLFLDPAFKMKLAPRRGCGYFTASS